MKLTTTRYLDGEVRAYQVSGGVDGPLATCCGATTWSLAPLDATGTLRAAYSPSAGLGCGCIALTRWRIAATTTCEVVVKADLDTSGHTAQHVQHPDGRHVLLGVGEDQNRVKIFRAALTGDSLDLNSYRWIDRWLVDLAPDGRWLMTVDHGQIDVAFHAFPDGEVVLRLPVAAFGYQVDESFIDGAAASST